jgi:putative glycosyltransferase
LIISKLFFNIAFEGWTSIVVSIWFFGGLIILLLGIIGIYLSKVFIEVKNRPYSIIKKFYGENNL